MTVKEQTEFALNSESLFELENALNRAMCEMGARVICDKSDCTCWMDDKCGANEIEISATECFTFQDTRPQEERTILRQVRHR